MSVFSEIKRRNVSKVAIAYVVAAWVTAQAAELLLDVFGVPPWVMQALFVLLGLGFIAAVIIAWAYEVTPDGIKRDADFTASDSFKQLQSRRLNIITIALLIVAIGLMLTDRLYLERNPIPAETGEVAEAGNAAEQAAKFSENEGDAPNQSIAVMPFIALTGEGDDAYFGKGLAEELLNALAQFPTLKVAARTSAFSFADQDVDLRTVAGKLGVAHVLEGSIRRSGDRIRITAQLIRAEDGFHLWSNTYERRLVDIFQIQDEIVDEISRILQIRLGVGAGAGRASDRQVDPQAYELYLRGLDLWWTREIAGNRAEAIEKFWRVTQLDPGFADGWSAYAVSVAFSDSSYAPHLEPDLLEENINSAFATALEIDPGNLRALGGLVYWHVNRKIDIPAANNYLQRAINVAPTAALTNYVASQFYFSVGDKQRTLLAINSAISADPLNQTLNRHKFQYSAAFGNHDPESSFLEGLNDCTITACKPVNWLKAWTALVAALHAADTAGIKQARDIFQEVYQSLGAGDFGRNAHEFMIAYADWVLGIDEHTTYWSNLDPLSEDYDTVFTLDACILAQLGFDEKAMTILEEVSANGRFFSTRGIPYFLSPGRLEMPESIRRNPRYHAIWSLPGMPEIELARRANGMTAGLPLPITNEGQ